MTPSTLVFLRNLCNRVNIPVNDPDFRTIALTMIAALEELDEEIAHANNTSRLDTSRTGDIGRTSVPYGTELDS